MRALCRVMQARPRRQHSLTKRCVAVIRTAAWLECSSNKKPAGWELAGCAISVGGLSVGQGPAAPMVQQQWL